VRRLVKRLMGLLEPTIILIMGLIVGFIVIALFAPMISLISTVSSPAKK
jgi:type IV pilus assembly protein PilC